MTIELTPEETTLIILGMTSAQYPLQHQKKAFELVMRLRDLLVNEKS